MLLSGIHTNSVRTKNHNSVRTVNPHIRVADDCIGHLLSLGTEIIDSCRVILSMAGFKTAPEMVCMPTKGGSEASVGSCRLAAKTGACAQRAEGR